MEKEIQEKLEILLKHWARHNEEHTKEFEKWAKRALSSGNIEIHDNISNAIKKMRKANEYLLKALKIAQR